MVKESIISMAVIVITIIINLFNNNGLITLDEETNNDDNTSCYENSSEYVDEQILQNISNEIISAQYSYYDDVYSFDNWSFTIENESIDEDTYFADIELTVDMTLCREPEQSPYYLGLTSGNINNAGSTDILLTDVSDEYLNLVDRYYLCPYETTFLYSAEVDINENNMITLYRKNYEEGYELVSTEDKFSEILTYEQGVEDAEKIENNINLYAETANLSGYSASGAVSYAVLHATDEPEFAGNNSDCANFVSKCINAGGISTDTSGNWYPASTWGDAETAGINWIRTGYNNYGGIIQYFSDKGYISSVPSSSAYTGSIMCWNESNHVAIVTYYDGSTIKYSQHSNTKKDNVYYTYTSEDVTFYKFN
ncbi:MAG: amidase domain-containing protein [Lachnospiraceae bacterium]|nr:amidase domain-containing protein [Lachnospiraceae bacterium]